MITEMTDHLGRIVRVDVYPVGHLRNFQELRAAAKGSKSHVARKSRWWLLRRRTKMLLGDLLIKRRNYWNGYLAEPQGSEFVPGKCGHGWTQKRAMAKLAYYWETTRWGRHRCGLVRRICGGERLKFFCVYCNTSDRDWSEA